VICLKIVILKEIAKVSQTRKEKFDIQKLLNQLAE